MKITSNQVNHSVNSISNQNAGNQAAAAKRDKLAEGTKEVDISKRPEPNMDEKQLLEFIEKTNKAFEGTSCSFRYAVHDVTKQIMVKVIDRETQEVIKEFPPEKILDMVAKMWEVAGILVDERR
jgi:flagellar protein FlaG